MAKNKQWNYKYNNYEISVVDDTNLIELNINGQRQDVLIGLNVRQKMSGRLPTGEKVKAIVGVDLNLKNQCFVFVNCKELTPITE